MVYMTTGRVCSREQREIKRYSKQTQLEESYCDFFQTFTRVSISLNKCVEFFTRRKELRSFYGISTMKTFRDA